MNEKEFKRACPQLFGMVWCQFVCANSCVTGTGLATRLPQPKDLFAYAKSCMYSPTYRTYR